MPKYGVTLTELGRPRSMQPRKDVLDEGQSVCHEGEERTYIVNRISAHRHPYAVVPAPLAFTNGRAAANEKGIRTTPAMTDARSTANAAITPGSRLHVCIVPVVPGRVESRGGSEAETEGK
jgi:hypothetical protein